MYARTIGILLAALGGAVAIAIMEALATRSAFPLMAVPFATSIVLVTGSPDVDAAQPRPLIGGHIISTIVGLSVLAFAGPEPWAAAFAVGLSIAAMHVTRTFHPPAGIDPLVVVTNNMPWTFLFVPVAAGALILAAYAYFWNRYMRRCDWPKSWC